MSSTLPDNANIFSFWKYRAVFTQTAGGGGNIVVDFGGDIADEFQLEWLRIGADDYAAGRAMLTDIIDSEATPNIVGSLLSESIDNAVRQWPFRDGQTEDFVFIKPATNYYISGTDKLTISIAAAVQNETLTINIRAKLYSARTPTISTARSTGTVTTTTTYDSVE